MIVKLREVGNSMTVTIPKDIVSNLKLSAGMETDITAENRHIILKPVSKDNRITLKSLFENYQGSYTPEEFDWGERKGKEVW